VSTCLAPVRSTLSRFGPALRRHHHQNPQKCDARNPFQIFIFQTSKICDHSKSFSMCFYEKHPVCTPRAASQACHHHLLATSLRVLPAYPTCFQFLPNSFAPPCKSALLFSTYKLFCHLQKINSIVFSKLRTLSQNYREYGYPGIAELPVALALQPLRSGFRIYTAASEYGANIPVLPSTFNYQLFGLLSEHGIRITDHGRIPTSLPAAASRYTLPSRYVLRSCGLEGSRSAPSNRAIRFRRPLRGRPFYRPLCGHSF
jgi:hypothetical protein